MRIKIQQFEVVERAVLRDTIQNSIWKWLFGTPEPDQYHFDVKIRIVPMMKRIEPGTVVQLPNEVRLQVWSVDRHDIIRAKTMMFINEDLRGYSPSEMYVVYKTRTNQ